MVSINNAREKIPDVFHNDSCVVNKEPLVKSTRCECFDEEISMILEEVCDIVVTYCTSRFAVTGHLVTATFLRVVHSQTLSNASQPKLQQHFLLLGK